MNVNITESPSRWFMLTLYSFSIGCNAMIWISVSPILSVVSDVIFIKTYDVSEIFVELCLLVFMIVYIPIVFPCNYILEVYGLRIGVFTI